MIFTVQQRRTTVIYILILSMILFAVIRLYTVMSFGKASEVLSGQYTRRLDVTERRGFIYDRNGELLNMVSDGYICMINPEQCADILEASKKVSEVSVYSQSEIYDRMLGKIPFTLKTYADCEYEGINCYKAYNNETVCAPHIVGYTNGTGNGVSGIEKYFDKTLSDKFSGKVSFRYMSDLSGSALENTLGYIYDTGYTGSSGIYLTIDSKLQQFCEKLVENLEGSGAICVTDTENGEILASVSFPDFDTKKVAEYLESDKGELVNRCTALFTPGSIFKTVVAAAALETNPELYNMQYECCGNISTENVEVFPCHKNDGHGIVDMKNAYAQSCNPYFINLAMVVGEEKIRETAELMGLTEYCSIDGIFHCGSVILEYDDNISTHAGYLSNLAIGQGKTLITPIGACTMFSCAVTGVYNAPGIISKICADEYTVRDYTKQRNGQWVLSEVTTSYLSEMMYSCVEVGLGKDAKPNKGTAGGKTATAQTGIYIEDNEVLNCWFCGIYPVNEPKYTICALYCDDKNGGTAKYLFRQICDYLSDQCEELIFE